MNEFHEGFIKTQEHPEINIHYVEINNRPRNPLIIFLHGFPEFWYAWRHYLKPVAEQGYHCVALDLRGYNESSKPQDDSQYEFAHLVEDIRQIIKFFGFKKTFLVGHDWGGLITWEFAFQYPEYLEGIVVLNAPFRDAAKKNLKRNFCLGFKQNLRSWYVYFFQIPFLPELTLSYMNFKALENVFIKEVSRMKSLTRKEVDTYLFALKKPGALAAAIKYYRANFRGWTKLKAAPILVPTLLLWGEKDIAIEKDLLNGIEEFFPFKIVKHFYPQSTHWIHLEYLRNVQNEILYFMASVRNSKIEYVNCEQSNR